MFYIGFLDTKIENAVHHKTMRQKPFMSHVKKTKLLVMGMLTLYPNFYSFSIHK